MSACNLGFDFIVFFAKLRISSLLDSIDICTSSFAPPRDMKSLALSSVRRRRSRRVKSMKFIAEWCNWSAQISVKIWEFDFYLELLLGKSYDHFPVLFRTDYNISHYHLLSWAKVLKYSISTRYFLKCPKDFYNSQKRLKSLHLY